MVSEIYPLLERLERKDILQVLQFLVDKLAMEEGIPPGINIWPPGFFAETYGILRDEPLVREPQGEYEVREDLT